MKKTWLIMLAMVIGMTAIAYTVQAKQAKAAKETQQTWYNVSGHVTDENGGSLPGVNVMIKGTQTGVITDGGGDYSFGGNLIEEGTTLVFSYLGYKTKEVTVRSHIVDVQMELDNKEY